MTTDTVLAQGAEVYTLLASRFPQLYVAPAEDAQEAYRAAAGRGQAPTNASLEHFETSPDDELRLVDTPAGPVEVVFLHRRHDFETFLQIVGHKAQPVAIAPTIGAITYRGLADWSKVAAAYQAYVASGGDNWPAEFARLAREPEAFRCELIIISEGPYSNIAAAQTPYDEDEWLHISREVRLHHECAHVVCRRVMPTDILPVWDEVTADVVGLICGTGHYDAQLAARFLGVRPQGYLGGRLQEYLDDQQREEIDQLARETFASLKRIEELAQGENLLRPFDFLLQLKREPLLSY